MWTKLRVKNSKGAQSFRGKAEQGAQFYETDLQELKQVLKVNIRKVSLCFQQGKEKRNYSERQLTSEQRKILGKLTPEQSKIHL